MSVQLFAGDCIATIKTLPPNSVDSIVTDPPYHLTSVAKRYGGENAALQAHGTDGLYARASAGFMGKQWDGGDIAFKRETWAEMFRVLKPGGHLVAFGAPRGYHRMACAIEDAGFEIRDSLMWLFGTGFPKSHDVSKGIDAKKLTGSARTEDMRRLAMGEAYEPSGRGRANYDHGGGSAMNGAAGSGPQTEEAARWQGWGTALKPAYEPIVLARKPLIGTVAENVMAHGTGAINIDATRIPTEDKLGGGDQSAGPKVKTEGWDRPWMQDEVAKAAHAERVNANVAKAETLGRWPANVVHDGSDEVVGAFPEANSARASGNPNNPRRGINHTATSYGKGDGKVTHDFRDRGSAARFFYSAKANAKDRAGSKHPTVKPVALMRWLCRLVTPPGGVILDPFAGSGTTGQAALEEGFSAILCEREEEYLADIRRRLEVPAEVKAETVNQKHVPRSEKKLPLFDGIEP